MIILNKIVKTFSCLHSSAHVLNEVTATFNKNCLYGITGHSGSGKSTLLSIISGLEAPTSGSVMLDEHNLFSMSLHKKTDFLQNFFGLVFQYSHLISELTVIENVALKGLIFGMPLKKRVDRAGALLEIVGLSGHADQHVHLLSGGEQQRVALARALFTQPQFLVADEPTAHLDEFHTHSIMKLIKQFHHEYGMGVIIASHDPLVIAYMDKIFELKQGKLA